MPSDPSTRRPASLDRVIEAFSLAPHAVQCFDPAASAGMLGNAQPRFDAQRPLLVLAPQFEVARGHLDERYPAGTAVRVLASGQVRDVALDALPGHAEAWLLPALPPEEDLRSLDGLRGVMERLFGPDGCPWDREQTAETLRPFFLEECYELVDAIDRGDHEGLREELGDVFAHLFMQTAIAQVEGRFSVEEVAAYASAKFVRRHPHVFGDEQAEGTEQLLGRWEEIKADERTARGETGAEEPGALDSVPRAAPSLQRVQAMLRRAERTAPELVTWMDPREAAAWFDGESNEENLGELLWAAVAIANGAGVDAEETLRRLANQFAAEFAEHERARRTS
ncbi:MAG: MazG family protein [Dehalococcoidia bacterium]|nr:MazG family protein [Dehalococcoidia bacterium]